MLPQVETILQRCDAVRYRILTSVTAATPAELGFHPGGGARWSARETLIHMVNWEEEAVRYLDHLLRGEPIPSGGYKHVDEQNAAMLAPYADADLAFVVDYAERMRTAFGDRAGAITAEQWEAERSFLGVLLMIVDHDLGHTHQVLEALALARGELREAALHYLNYARERTLCRLNIEHRAVASNEFPVEGLSVKDLLAGLAARDLALAAALGQGEMTLPADPVPDAGHQTLAAVLHDLGRSRGRLEAELQRLPAERFAEEATWTWLAGVREYENKLIYQLIERLMAWRKAGN